PCRLSRISRGNTFQKVRHARIHLVFGAIAAYGDVGTLVLRLFFGPLLATHGYPKLTSGRAGTTGWLESMGLPKLLGRLIGTLELFGGFFLVIGFLTPVVAFLFSLQFLGIYLFRKRLGKKTLSDYEKDLLYLGSSLALVLLGGGLYSVDHLVGL
ncbi:MAG TPA: DoxX family protein, partial [Nitrososphaerales archaeon]|nr:DoxX family protein [Nitrososphaerales archaeon]